MNVDKSVYLSHMQKTYDTVLYVLCLTFVHLIFNYRTKGRNDLGVEINVVPPLNGNIQQNEELNPLNGHVQQSEESAMLSG